MDVLRDCAVRLLFCRIRLCSLFSLQCREEALRDRIIPAVSFPTHARDHAERTDSIAKVVAGVLAAAVGVKQRAGRRGLEMTGVALARQSSTLPARDLGCNSPGLLPTLKVAHYRRLARGPRKNVTRIQISQAVASSTMLASPECTYQTSRATTCLRRSYPRIFASFCFRASERLSSHSVLALRKRLR